jgi:hypothetical protein
MMAPQCRPFARPSCLSGHLRFRGASSSQSVGSFRASCPILLVWPELAVVSLLPPVRPPAGQRVMLGSPPVPDTSSFKFSPLLSPAQWASFFATSSGFARVFTNHPPTGLGGKSRSAHYPTVASHVGIRRVLTSAPPRNPAVPNRAFRFRAVPSARELRFFEKLVYGELASIKARTKLRESRPSRPAAREVSVSRPTHRRPSGPRG